MKSSNRRVFFEVLIILIVMTGLSFLVPAIKGPLEILVVVYFIVERFLRHRTWSEIGFKPNTFFKDLLANWWLVVLVGFVTQIIPILIAKTILPEYLTHIQERLPLNISASIGMLAVSLLVATLAEELVYRALFQERLAWGLGTPLALALVVLVFAAMHWAPGRPEVVFTDLAFVAIDAVIYGAIFARCKNIFVAWLAHFLADVVGLALIIILIH
jgi:membrane protease YdiL (CAAX protease family)